MKPDIIYLTEENAKYITICKSLATENLQFAFYSNEKNKFVDDKTIAIFTIKIKTNGK